MVRDELLIGSGKSAAWSGAVMGILGGIRADIVFGILGFFVAMLGVYVTRYYQRKRERREAQVTAAHLAAMQVDEDRKQAEERRKQELHAARMRFMARSGNVSSDIAEAHALGIDTTDWPESQL